MMKSKYHVIRYKARSGGIRYVFLNSKKQIVFWGPRERGRKVSIRHFVDTKLGGVRDSVEFTIHRGLVTVDRFRDYVHELH